MSFPRPRPISDPTPEKAYLYAIRLLAKRDYSEVKMRQKLRDKGFPADHQDYAIEEIIRKNYLREDSYINAKIKTWMHKGYSPSLIEMKFSQEQLQVDQNYIKSIFQQENVTVEDQIEALALKKKASAEIFANGQEAYKKKQKILSFLVSKGHDIGTSLDTLQNMFNRSHNTH